MELSVAFNSHSSNPIARTSWMLTIATENWSEIENMWSSFNLHQFTQGPLFWRQLSIVLPFLIPNLVITTLKTSLQQLFKQKEWIDLQIHKLDQHTKHRNFTLNKSDLTHYILIYLQSNNLNLISHIIFLSIYKAIKLKADSHITRLP